MITFFREMFLKPDLEVYATVDLVHRSLCHSRLGTLKSIPQSTWYIEVYATVDLVHRSLCHSRLGTLKSMPQSTWYIEVYTTVNLVHRSLCHSRLGTLKSIPQSTWYIEVYATVDLVHWSLYHSQLGTSQWIPWNSCEFPPSADESWHWLWIRTVRGSWLVKRCIAVLKGFAISATRRCASSLGCVDVWGWRR